MNDGTSNKTKTFCKQFYESATNPKTGPPIWFSTGLLCGGMMGLMAVPLSLLVGAGTFFYIVSQEEEKNKKSG